MRLLSNLSVSKKLITLTVGLLVPLVLVTGFYVKSQLDSIAFSNKERIGVEYLVKLRPVWTTMAQHRGLTQGVLSGNAAAKNKVLEIRNKVDQALKDLTNIDAKLGASLQTGDRVSKLKDAWAKLINNYNSLTVSNNFPSHNEVISAAHGLGSYVGDTSNLILDPDLDSFYLMEALVISLPKSLEYMGQLRGLSTGVAAGGGADEALRTTLNVLFVKSQAGAEGASASIGTSVANNADLGAELEPLAKALDVSSAKFLNLVEGKILSTSLVEADPATIFAAGTEAIAAGSALFAAVAPRLDGLLEARVDGQTFDLYEVMAVVTIFTLLSLLLAFLVIRGVTRNTSHASQVLARIAGGDYDNEVQVESTDELGTMLTSLRNMQSDLKSNLESERHESRANARISQALNSTTSSVLIANQAFEIFYLNESAKSLMRDAESELRAALPNFSAADLKGASIDVLHTDPERTRAMLNGLTSATQSEFTLAGLSFRVTYTPVQDDSGSRIGTIMEWTNRTAELAMEQEIQGVVNAAKCGDLSGRVDANGKTGFAAILSEPLNELLDICEKVVADTTRVFSGLAAGDLTQSISTEYEGEFGKLKEDANSTVARLTEVIGQIKNGAEEINSETSSISQGNSDLSRRTEQQAASLEQTASSMEEMTGTVKRNAENATEASALSSATRDEAERGGEVVDRAVDAMQEINTASQKIADIIGVIDEIAFQTNLLALNAAVEAARAGEQGRGFAVVATEVRNLAQRSATAAKEIKELIEDSVGKVATGTKLVDESGTTLKQIVDSVKKVSDIVAEIAAASQEQSQGIGQVNTAITQMDSATQQNAALVEEAAAASESMAEQAARMHELVSFFKSDSTVAAMPVPRPAAPSRSKGPSSTAGSSGFSGNERRSAERPWSEGSKTNASASSPAVENELVATGTDDDDWEEF